VGVDGELEHAAAILHPSSGTHERGQWGRKGHYPFSEDKGGLDRDRCPLHYKDAAFVANSFWMPMAVRVHDAPRSDERSLFALVVTDSGDPTRELEG